MPSPASIRAAFRRDGYYVARGLFKPAQVKRLERAFDRIVAQNVRFDDAPNKRWRGEAVDRLKVGETTLIHTHQVHFYSAEWLQAVQDPRFLDVAEAILGPDVVLHHTKLFQKPAEKGAPFPMHQDWSYFPSVKNTMIAAIIHVSPATDEMGCLRVYPGSHRLGRRKDTSGQVYSRFMEKNYPLDGGVAVESKPGDVVFFSYFTVHGSKPNRSSRLRKTVLVQLYSGKDRIEPQVMHADSRLVLRGWSHVASQAYCEGHR
ncbi:MAG TPA: phytanoyl-CoA dioxygenase family protein [Opitutaceae bacterium]|nr:phytanoyl-CoA dioxygenase family protein [Opitutaceae bacterium]